MAKIGDGHVSAMARQGLRELRSALYPNSNIASQTEYGIYGTKTPGEVAQDRDGKGEPDEEKSGPGSLVNDRVKQTEGRTEPSGPNLSMER